MENHNMKRIAVDMDEVLADAIVRYFEWYERDFGEPFPQVSLKGKKPKDVVTADRYEIVRRYPHQPGFFKDLPVIAGSVEVMKELIQSYEVYITTAAMEFKHSFVDI